MSVSEQLERILLDDDRPFGEIMAELLQLIETLVDDAYIAGRRRKQPPTID